MGARVLLVNCVENQSQSGVEGGWVDYQWMRQPSEKLHRRSCIWERQSQFVVDLYGT